MPVRALAGFESGRASLTGGAREVLQKLKAGCGGPRGDCARQMVGSVTVQATGKTHGGASFTDAGSAGKLGAKAGDALAAKRHGA